MTDLPLANNLTHSPTPLTAKVVSYTPVSIVNLNSLSNTFRYSVQLKYDRLNDDRGLFVRAFKTRFRQWIVDILKGLEGGAAVMRLACAGGLLLGLNDLVAKIDLASGRSTVEDEVVVALAEVMDLYEPRKEWEKEFQQGQSAYLPFLESPKILIALQSMRFHWLSSLHPSPFP
jgi:hypothetical protein